MSIVIKLLISTIIPVHNRPILLKEAVNSVLSQNYRPLELVIVDDGSTDGTGEIAEWYRRNHEGVVKVLHQEKRGPGGARQAGLRIAKGEFIQFLDSDDLLLPRKFENQVKGLRKHPECSISYGKTREYVIGETPVNIPARRTGEQVEKLFPAALMGRIWATETPLYRRSVLEDIGPWSGLRVLEDWEYECRLGARKEKLHYCNEFVADVRHHEGEREGLRWQTDIEVFKDMLTAHVRVLGYALDAGITSESPEMKFYARNLFRLAREAGVRGLVGDASRLLTLAGQIDSSRNAEYLLYRGGAVLFGWQCVSHWGEHLASWRRHGETQCRSLDADIS